MNYGHGSFTMAIHAVQLNKQKTVTGSLNPLGEEATLPTVDSKVQHVHLNLTVSLYPSHSPEVCGDHPHAHIPILF